MTYSFEHAQTDSIVIKVACHKFNELCTKFTIGNLYGTELAEFHVAFELSPPAGYQEKIRPEKHAVVPMYALGRRFTHYQRTESFTIHRQ